MKLTQKAWIRYITILARMNNLAAEDVKAYYMQLKAQGLNDRDIADRLIDYSYGVATKYGEGAATAACEMYDAEAALQGANVPPAIPAETATYGEVAKAINGTIILDNSEILAGSIGRLVKMAGVDTTMQNAIRDHAEWAWIPQGETCAFCITLASRGWQPASDSALKGGHAPHIHSNCDCTYSIRFRSDFNVEGYDPDLYLDMYNEGEGNSNAKINAMRRRFYQENKDKINAQKRSAYQKRRERESSQAEEINVN